jgi:hypothetical protein
MRRSACISAILLASLAPGVLSAVDPDRDFSGRWILDASASNSRPLPGNPEQSLTITEEHGVIQCTGSSGAQWSYALNGSERESKVGAEIWNSQVKWEGAALLINTLVSGPRNSVVMDRWKLSRDFATLTITRQVERGTWQTEGQLVYHREGISANTGPPPPPQAVLTRKPEPPADAGIIVPAGTRILLEMLNSVDTKHSYVGQRIYLRTAFPIAQDGRIVVPSGSAVTGSVTELKRPGHAAKGGGQLYVRFDSLTLPNGVTRDFRSRLGSADVDGKVDSKEGKITGQRDNGKDARTVAETAGVGGTVGGVAGRSISGIGLGAAAGAAGGLIYALGKRGPDAVLPRGTRVEMVLDRDLRFSQSDLRF